MAVHEDFCSLIRKLRWCGRNSQFQLKDAVSPVSVHNGTGNDLKMLLDLVNTADDTDLQVKLFSILTSYLLTNDTYKDIIMTCSHMYDKINSLLKKNYPQKSYILLNFLTLLLYTDNEEDGTSRKKSLILYAKNMIRVSGCLATMSDFFISGMMYQETWRALCRCLVQSCNCYEVNQTFCTNLIPTSVLRWSQGSTEVLPVLHSLLCNHEHNTQIFLQCNGMSLFTGASLQSSTCLQLLCTVIQTSTSAALKVHNTKIFEYVKDVLRSKGPYSQMGQWATIILFYADARTKGHGKEAKDNNINDQYNQNKAIDPEVRVDSKEPQDENTTALFQNVINEIIHWQPKNKSKHPNKRAPNDEKIKPNWTKRDARENIEPSNNRLTSEICKNLQDIRKFSTNNRRRNNHSHHSNEMSFSFLQKQHYKGRTQNIPSLEKKIRDINSKPPLITNTKNRQSKKGGRQTNIGTTSVDTSFQGESNILDNLCTQKCGDENIVTDIEDFKPVFSSTPNNSNIIAKTNRSISPLKPNKIKKGHDRPKPKTSRISKHKYNKDSTINTLQKTVCSEFKQRSFSSRFFDAINDSCTTLVKTVKSIFTTDKNTNNCKPGNDVSCSYSFTNYMRKRDAVLADNHTADNFSNDEYNGAVDLCKTCNDTFVLKHKMENDEYLKETVKKIKLGINLYGCDFKKIANTMWPRDSCMTPDVLKNLYRKLLIK